MCELMTVAAALLCTATYAFGRKSEALFTTALLFWGAALMWSVDCVHSALEGDGFFDLSAGDARLGALVLAAGLGCHAVFAAAEKRRREDARP